MKHFFCILLLNILVISVCNSQATYFNDSIYQQLGTKRTHVKALGYFTADSLFRLPKDTLHLAPNGSIAWKAGVLYQKDTTWKTLTGSGGFFSPDQTSTGTTNHELDGNIFNLISNGESFIHIDPTPGAESSFFQAYNQTGLGNFAVLANQATNVNAQSVMQASFNASKQAFVILEASSGVSLVDITADSLELDIDRTVPVSIADSALHWMVVMDRVTGVARPAHWPGGSSGSSVTVNSGVVNTLAYYEGSNLVADLPTITANRALVSDGLGLPLASSVTTTTLGYLDVTSSAQTQLNGKANSTLNNIGSTAFNAAIIPDGNNTRPIGSTSLALSSVFTYNVALKGATSGEWTLLPAATGTGNISLPGTATTLAGLAVTQTFSQVNTFSNQAFLTAGLFTNASPQLGNFAVTSGQGIALVTTDAAFQINGSTNSNYRVNLGGGSTASVLTNGAVYNSVIIPNRGATEGTASAHVGLGAMAIEKQTFTNGSATTTDMWGLYIQDAPDGVTPTGKSYALWVDAGRNRFDGIFNAAGTDLTANQFWGANAAGTAMEGKSFTSSGTTVTITYPSAGVINLEAAGGGSGTVSSGTANRLAYYPTTSTTVDDLAAITASKLLGSDANGLPVALTPTVTEANYLAGVTSLIQTQFTGKAAVDLSNVADNGANALIYQTAQSGAISAPAPVGSARFNYYSLTGLSTNATFAAPSGTPANHNWLSISLSDNGTARTLAWNAIYDEGTDLPLPTTTVAGEGLEAQFKYNSATSKWRYVGQVGGFMVLNGGMMIQMVSEELATRIINLKHRFKKAA